MANIIGKLATAIGVGGKSGQEPTETASVTAASDSDPGAGETPAGPAAGPATAGTEPISGAGGADGSIGSAGPSGGGQSTGGTDPITPPGSGGIQDMSGAASKDRNGGG